MSVIFANKIAINNNAEYYYVIHDNSQTQKIKTLEDFKIFDIYSLIEDEIINMHISKLEKLIWLLVIYKRKKKDFKTFYKTMSQEYKNKFKKQMQKELFPKKIFLYLNKIYFAFP